jgi:outer membrane receptor protein involved in Fe transport
MYGNPNLKPEFTNAFELNYQYTFKQGFMSLETYYRTTNGKITRISGVDTISGKPVYTFTSTNANNDNSLGIELMAGSMHLVRMIIDLALDPLEWRKFGVRS